MKLRRAARAALALLVCGWAGCESVVNRIPGVESPLEVVVDSMLPDLERLSGLTAVAPVRVASKTPADVRQYVEQRLHEHLPAAELEGMRRAYVLFGLLPDSLDLRSLLLDVYAEQIAGFYDPVSETLYVVEGTLAASLRPVLAHELVHALQDQYVDVDSLISRRWSNDRQTAAQAALEGHATLTMFAWLAEAVGRRPVDPATLPDPAAQIRSGFEDSAGRFPVFRGAPRIMRETMLFPYTGGARFVQALWRSQSEGDRKAPFGLLLPRSTEQVLQPVERFIDGPDEPTELRFEAVPGWSVEYENTLGALETNILLEESLGSLDQPWRGWDGDRFVLLERSAERVLVWASVWDDVGSADLFAQRMDRIASGGRVKRVQRADLQGRPLVLVVIGGSVATLDALPVASVHCADESGVPTSCGPF